MVRAWQILVVLSAALLVGAACPQKKKAPVIEQPGATPGDTAHKAPAEPGANGEQSPDAAPDPGFSPIPAGKRAVLLFTASVQGYVEPCGCTGDPLGGVARAGGVIAAAKKAYGNRVIFVDAGDLLFEKEEKPPAVDQCQDDARIDLLLSSYARFGLKATVPGPRDEVDGVARAQAAFSKHGIEPLGIGFSEKHHPKNKAPTHRIEALADGIKLGITGFRLDNADDLKTVQDALKKVVQELKSKKVDAIVALAQAKRGLARGVLSEVPGIDVAILGRDPGESPVPPMPTGPKGTAIVVAAGMQAQHLGVVELNLDGRQPDAPLALDDRAARAEARMRTLKVRLEGLRARLQEAEAGAQRDFLDKKVNATEVELTALQSGKADATPLSGPHIKFRSVPLARGMDEEARAQKELDAYNDAIPSLVSQCEEKMECPKAVPGAPTFVGTQACAQCHAAAVDHWRKAWVELEGRDKSGNKTKRQVGHAMAWQTLQEEQKTKDRKCVGCHSVGFMVPGGYCRVSEVDFRENVQCESCHGPGSTHVSSNGELGTIARSVPEEKCRSCHHVPHIPTTESFVYKDKLNVILGKGHGAAFLKKINGDNQK
jgi:hypothetical protein